MVQKVGPSKKCVYFFSLLESVNVTLFRKGSFGDVNNPGWPQTNKNVLETLLPSLQLLSTITYFSQGIKEGNKLTCFRIIFIFIFILFATCKSVCYRHVWCLQKPEEGVISSGNGITDSCHPLCGF